MMKNIPRQAPNPLAISYTGDLRLARGNDRKTLESCEFQKLLFETMAGAALSHADALRRTFARAHPKMQLALSESADADGHLVVSLFVRPKGMELELLRITQKIGAHANNCEYEPGPMFNVHYSCLGHTASENIHYSRADRLFGIMEGILGADGWLSHKNAAANVRYLLKPKEE